MLAMPDFSLPFELEIDASNYAIGAILMQQNHPITFFNKKMGTKMCEASTYVRELFAITIAISKWRHYLLGVTFIINTEYRSLNHLIDQVIQTPEQHQYLRKLLGFNYAIVYKLGKQNNVEDALSKNEEDHEAATIGATQQLLVSDGVYCALTTVTFQFCCISKID